MRARKPAQLLLVPVWFLLLVTIGWAQEENRLQFKAGFSYEEGDFGTDVTTKTIYVPFIFRYLKDPFDLGLTIPYVDQETSRSVTVLDGIPVRIKKKGDRVMEKGVSREADTVEQSASGLGDIVFKGRFYLLEDPGPLSPLPAVTPFYQLKFPTADEDDGLGTGEFDHGFGLEFDKAFHDRFLFAHVGYTFIGDPPGTDLRNRVAAGGGAGLYFTDDLSGSVALDWRRSLVEEEDDPVDLSFDLFWRPLEDLSLNPYVSVGLTEGSPDYGIGFQVSYGFDLASRFQGEADRP